jgi:hypothetical protein
MASKLSLIQDGDILLYKPPAGISMEGAISVMEKDNTDSDKWDMYAHAGIVTNALNNQGYEQNPPATHYTDLRGEPWDRIDVWRLLPAPLKTLDVPRLRSYAAQHLGIPYPYGMIAKYLQADIVGQHGLPGLAKWLDNLGPTTDPSHAVCSATVCLALWSSVDLKFDGQLWTKPCDEMRPCDIPLGMVTQIA